jgi:hypothetical protein
VRFEAVAHRDAPTLWRVESERAIAWLAIAGGRGMQVEAQPPNATRESRADGALVLRFAPAAPSAIDLEVVLRDSGWSRRRLEIEGAAPLHVEQLVLP